jgi:hypothetical protein
MIRSAIVAVSVSLLGACATPRDGVPDDRLSGTPTPAGELAATIAPAEAVAANIQDLAPGEFERTLVCEKRKRPGSRIAEDYCFWSEPYAGGQLSESEEVDYLLREHARTIALMEQAETDRRLSTPTIPQQP